MDEKTANEKWESYRRTGKALDGEFDKTMERFNKMRDEREEFAGQLETEGFEFDPENDEWVKK